MENQLASAQVWDRYNSYVSFQNEIANDNKNEEIGIFHFNCSLSFVFHLSLGFDRHELNKMTSRFTSYETIDPDDGEYGENEEDEFMDETDESEWISDYTAE